MKKKKILFLLPNLEAGGAERVLINYTRILDAAKYEMTLIIINDYGDLQNYIPGHVKLVNLNIKRSRYAFLKLIQATNSIQPDYIFSSTNRTNILLLLIKPFLKGSPKIIIREPSSPKALYETKYLKKYYKLLSCFLYPRANKIIAQTESMKNEIERIYHINDRKVINIQNPLDTNYINSSLKQSKNPFNCSTTNIVAAGRLRKIKGFDILIKSFKKVLASDENFRLYILGKKTGTESCTQELEKLIKTLNLQKFVKLIGHKKNPYPYYKNADLFVLSSRWEGMPNVVLENLYLGTPVVATRCVPILSELIHDGENGKLVDIGNTDQMAVAILNYSKYTDVFPIRSSNEEIENLFNQIK